MFGRILVAIVIASCALSNANTSQAGQVDDASVARVFADSHDGWSVDEVILDDGRRQRFLEACRNAGMMDDEKSLLEALIHVRKSGNLHAKATKSNRQSLSDELIAAEIAARGLYDRHQVHMDKVLIDPEFRKEFDDMAHAINPTASAYAFRKAALRLRKSRKLRPELVLRVTDWKKEILEMSVADAKSRLHELPTRPAVYIFRDGTGFLYIGQTNNLRERMAKHLMDSDRKALTEYLRENTNSPLHLEMHVFLKGSPAEETVVREAYESELIRSRQPRLNIAP